MVTKTDIVNRALQNIGTRTTVTDAELAASSTNEAIQANLIYDNTRDDLLRMAPWNCGLDTENLVYITSTPGTPENTSPATPLWEKGQPPPGWPYEYQYPVDCLRPCYIIPSQQTGFANGVPITTAVTGGSPAVWQGPPIRYKVQIDQFRPVTAAALVAGGLGHAVGDIITLPLGPITSPPIGAPVQLLVLTVNGSGAILTFSVVNQIIGSATPLGGSYFGIQAGTIPQGTTTGVGTGASFTLTQGPKGDQRVILTNQEFATLAYVRQVTDPNVWDTLFQSAMDNILGAQLVVALTGDKALANMLVAAANATIIEARKADGNEGLTINDVTPDWIRIRGINYYGEVMGPWSGFDWGQLWPQS